MARRLLRVAENCGIDLSGRAIEVVVGREPSTSMFVHEILICASSDFFKKAMSRNWKESEQRSIRLEDDAPDTFQLYLHWLYRGTLPLKLNEPGLKGNLEYVRLAQAYVLGDKLQDSSFQDFVINAIVDKCKSEASDGRRWYPLNPVIQIVYDNTTEASKARRLLVDLYASNGCGTWLYEYNKAEDLPKDFLLDIAVQLLDKKTNNPIKKHSLCEYHQHGSDSTLCHNQLQS